MLSWESIRARLRPQIEAIDNNRAQNLAKQKVVQTFQGFTIVFGFLYLSLTPLKKGLTHAKALGV